MIKPWIRIGWLLVLVFGCGEVSVTPFVAQPEAGTDGGGGGGGDDDDDDDLDTDLDTDLDDDLDDDLDADPGEPIDDQDVGIEDDR